MDVSLDRNNMVEIVRAIRQWPWLGALPGAGYSQDYIAEPSLQQPILNKSNVIFLGQRTKPAKIRRG